MKNMVKVLIFLMVFLSIKAQAQELAGEIPWWQQQKIRFMWGQWNHVRMDQSVDFWDVEMDLPRELFRNVSQAGGTVFAELRWYKPRHARYAHEFGMRYFATAFVYDLVPVTGTMKDVRWHIDRNGGHGSGPVPYPCPLYKPVYEKWLLEPIMKGVKLGLIDGLHTDWEFYGKRGEATVCYCDECLLYFLKEQQKQEDMPRPNLRYEWLKQRHLLEEYEKIFDRRRVEMFRGFEKMIHAINPTFAFSGYGMESVLEVCRGLNTPDVPYFFLDAAHYSEDHTRPWWDSRDDYYRRLGFLRIPGTWTHQYFGGLPGTNVSLSQWFYESAIHADGAWIWFEQEITPALWRAFWIGDRRIRAVEAKVEKYLQRGKRDMKFVTSVEWTGSPELAGAIKHVTYHLGDEHLVHIDNVDADRPLQVRIRFGHLAGQELWTVRDPLSGLYYSGDGQTAGWQTTQLMEGVNVSMEKRSDLFLLISPVLNKPNVDRSFLVVSANAQLMPDHTLTKPAVKLPAPKTSVTGGPMRLVYLATQALGYRGAQGGWAIGNAIFSIDANGKNNELLYGTKGYLWQPLWSPDGRRIIFSYYANGRGQIFAMNADGDEVVNLSRNSYCDRSPVWSPDGKQVTFVSDRDGDWEIYVMNGDGSSPERLTRNPGLDTEPVWSPDGLRIAFESDRGGNMDIYVMNADGSDQHALTNMPGHERGPAWSPDGHLIAFSTTSQRLRVAPVDGGEDSRIVAHILYDISSICWSPDGKYIAAAFRGPRERSSSGVLTVRSDGKSRKNVILAQAVRPYPSTIRKPHPTWYSSGSASPRWVLKTFGGLSWSPDSKRLAFSGNQDDGYFYVYTVKPQGGKLRCLDQTKSAWLQEITWRPQQSD